LARPGAMSEPPGSPSVPELRERRLDGRDGKRGARSPELPNHVDDNSTGSIIGAERADKPGWRCHVLEQSTVPDFFQEGTRDALGSQVDWLKLHVGLDDSLLVKLLDIDEQTFRNWRFLNADLPPRREDTLRRFWQTTLHLLSFLNFDRGRVRELFQHETPARSKTEASALAPPWNGVSFKEYPEQSGDIGIEKVDCWVTGLRFGDVYTA
jgi:hypothetical protein